MILGALFVAIAIVAGAFWATTNPPGESLKLWRFYLVLVAATNALFVFAPSPWAYLAALLLALAVAGAHAYNGHQWSNRRYVGITLACVAGVFVLAALSGPSLISLLFVLCGLFFTYSAVGQRWWNNLLVALR